jgi:hypothetical protein
MHFSLDFGSKQSYIWITLRSSDRKFDVRENRTMKNATKKAAKKAAKKGGSKKKGK